MTTLLSTKKSDYKKVIIEHVGHLNFDNNDAEAILDHKIIDNAKYFALGPVFRLGTNGKNYEMKTRMMHDLNEFHENVDSEYVLYCLWKNNANDHYYVRYIEI